MDNLEPARGDDTPPWQSARDTNYARLIGHVSITFASGTEARRERLFIKKYGQEEIRFS